MRRLSPYSRPVLSARKEGAGERLKSLLPQLALIFVLLLGGVKDVLAQEGTAFPRAEGERARYNVQIDFKKAYLSGVCLFLQEDGLIKASMVNEFGVSALDFTYDPKKKKVKIHHVIAQMNKWYIKRVLKRDLKQVMTLLPKGQNTYEDTKYHIRYTFDPMPQ